MGRTVRTSVRIKFLAHNITPVQCTNNLCYVRYPTVRYSTVREIIKYEAEKFFSNRYEDDGLRDG